MGTILPTFTLAPHTPAPTVTLAPLPIDVFDDFEAFAGYCKVKTSFGAVRSGATVEEQVINDMAVGQIWFSLYWSEGDLDLILVQPDGTLLDTSAIEADKRNKSFTSRHGFEEYFIRAPQLGTWTARIFGKSASSTGNAYMLKVEALDATTIAIHFDKDEFSSGDPAIISANLHDTDMTGDEMDGDGVFANTFDNTLVAGVYKFYFKISGRNQRIYYVNGDPQNPTHAPFERECFLSTELK